MEGSGGVGRVGRGRNPARLRANMQNPSMDVDYCQGISTKDLPFERETGKWNGSKGLAGIGEFGETGSVRVIRGLRRVGTKNRA